jgi:hypothetical protein
MKRCGCRSLSALLLAVLPMAAPAYAETGFDVSVERFEIQGDTPFVDEFDDGLRSAPPTSHFVDRGASEVSERGGALRLTDDDGADAGLTVDATVLDRPLVTATFRAPAPSRPDQVEGILLVRAALPSVELYLGRGLLGRQSMPWEPRTLDPNAPLVAPQNPFAPGDLNGAPVPRCGVGGELVVVLAHAGLPIACDEIAAAAPAGAVTLRLSIDGAQGALDAAYSLDGGATFRTGASWTSWRSNLTASLGAATVHAGLFAGGAPEAAAQWVDYTGFAPASGIVRNGSGAITSIAGSLSRQRFPTLPVPGAVGSDGTFSLTSANDSDLRLFPGVAELLTPRGRLHAVGAGLLQIRRRDVVSGRPLRDDAPAGARCETGAEPACLPLLTPGGLEILNVVCSASIGFSSVDRLVCGVPSLPIPRSYTAPLGALVGCGPLYGTRCDPTQPPASSEPAGLDLLNAEASALLQSWVRPGSPPIVWPVEPAGPQPGTIGFPAGPICTRVGPNGLVTILPGCRGPGDPGYDPAVDGANPTGTTIGFPPGVGSLPTPGLPTLGPILWGSGRADLAALSWNLQMLLVAGSAAPGTPGVDPVETYDPANAYRTDGCSFAVPQSCSAVRALRSLAVDPFADDPSAPPVRRWVWETGAIYRVTEASGEFAALVGGLLYVPGPLAATTRDAALIVPFFATPPPLVDADADGVRDAKDRCPTRADAGQDDRDADAVGDACDVCTLRADPLQRDTDHDGFGNRCDADLDNDGSVDLRDLAILKRRFFTRDPDADFDGDGFVGFRDLLVLRTGMFRAPGPSAPPAAP